MDFVNFMEKIDMSEITNMTALRRLTKIHNESKTTVEFIKEVMYDYGPKVDKLIEKRMKELSNEMFEDFENPNRALFSEQTVKRIMSQKQDKMVDVKE